MKLHTLATRVLREAARIKIEKGISPNAVLVAPDYASLIHDTPGGFLLAGLRVIEAEIPQPFRLITLFDEPTI